MEPVAMVSFIVVEIIGVNTNLIVSNGKFPG